MADQLYRADRDHGLDRSRAVARTPRLGMSPKSARVQSGHASGSTGPVPRVLELDGLRGFACLIIMIYHLRPALVPYGWSSVDFFFVLSGYLITTILIKHAGSPHLLRNFYVRRGLRIWPVYYLTILALVIAGPWLPRPTSWQGLGYYLTYTQNFPRYWSGRVPPFSIYAAHLWTLANEEQFYIVWPLMVVLAGRRAVIPLALAVTALSVAARAWGFDTLLLLARADGFALGGIVAAILVESDKNARQIVLQRRAFAAVTLCALAVVMVAMTRGDLPSFGRPSRQAAVAVLAINTVFAGVVGLVVMHAGTPAVAWLRRPRPVHLGKLSYGLYVYHYIVLVLVDDLLVAYRGVGRTSVFTIPVFVVIYALAAASWAWFEKPLLDLKSRFDYVTKKPQQIPAASARILR